MKACLFLANNEPMVVEDVTLDPPGAGEVHVKWSATGVCHSDVSIWQGILPIPPGSILGHEGAGTVLEVGEGVEGFAVGDHVVGNFNPICGECFFCKEGQTYICEQGPMIGMGRMPFSRSDGSRLFGGVGGLAGFSEEAIVHQSAIVKIPSGLPLEEACLIGCGVTTGVGAVMNSAKVKAGSTVAVIGCGGVGQSVVQGARLAGAANIVAIDLSESKRAAAISFGATHAIDPREDDPIPFLQGLTSGRGADYSFEVVGVAALQRQAYEMTRAGGTVCWVGVTPVTDEVSIPSGMMTLQNKAVLGTIYGSADVREDFVKYADYALEGKLNLKDMVSQRITINDINEAFEAILSGDVIRSVVIHDS